MKSVIEGLNAWFKSKYPNKGFFIYNAITTSNKIAKVFKNIEITIYYKSNTSKLTERVYSISQNYREDEERINPTLNSILIERLVEIILKHQDIFEKYGRRGTTDSVE